MKIYKWISQTLYVDIETGEKLTKQQAETNYRVISTKKHVTKRHIQNQQTQTEVTHGYITYTKLCRWTPRQIRIF